MNSDLLQKNLNVVKGLEPQALFGAFAELSCYPRESRNEGPALDFLIKVAKENGLKYRQDGVGNLVIIVPASTDMVGEPSICLQGHIDMVCEKVDDKTIDFATDGIQLVKHGNALCADGTSLGADNGLAIAAMIVLMRDMTIVHPKLELLVTVAEEVGFDGARALLPDFIKSTKVINMDSEEDDKIFVSCAGGGRMNIMLPFEKTNCASGMLRCLLTVNGGKGGHSGMEINQERANPIKLLARILIKMNSWCYQLVNIDGGSKMNAIPRDAEAELLLWSTDVQGFKKALKKIAGAIKAEFVVSDPGIDVGLTVVNKKMAQGVRVFEPEHQLKLLRLIEALPHGVLRFDQNDRSFVETSNNLGMIRTKRRYVYITNMFRGSVASQMTYIEQKLKSIANLAGACTKIQSKYPGWEPKFDSDLLATAKRVYKEMFGTEAGVEIIHAGLECGEMDKKFPGREFISFGSTLENVHTPDEIAYIDSVGKIWNFLLNILGQRS